MNMKKNKKGFTIVELVIVIAVIAILAAVLIPTFSGIVEKSKKSAVEQEAHNKYKEVYAQDVSDGKIDGKENETAIETESNWSYEVESEKITFKYSKNGYEIEYASETWGEVETESKSST